MAKLLSRLSFTALAGLLATSSFAATPSDSAVADDGRILRAVSGAYGDLFAGGDAANDGTRVLAFDIESADGSERLLVPSSETWRPESSPTLIWDSPSASSILLWLSGTGNESQHTVEFITRRDGEWGAVESARDGEGKLVRFNQQPASFVSYDELTFETTDSSLITVSRNVV
ncbi:MAG: hypothetical protein AAGF23_24195, partial [Acidobacteriota bacterium]